MSDNPRKCGCGYLRRGKNHDEGAHHKSQGGKLPPKKNKKRGSTRK